MLSKALLPEELNSIIVCISRKVLHANGLSVHLQSVQHECAEAVRLELGGNGEEYDFYEALRRERSEDAAADDLNLALIITRVSLQRVRQLLLK